MKKSIFGKICVLCFIFISCQSSFLDVKPNKSWVVPTSLQDLQAILDSRMELNIAPGINIPAADDFYTPDIYIQYLTIPQKNSYLWKPDIYEGSLGQDWNLMYKIVFYSNVVLEGVSASKPATDEEKLQWLRLNSGALFFRSFAYYYLSELFCKPYADQTADTDPGIPLRFTADINSISQRASLRQSYQQILDDLTLAIPYLPDTSPFLSRPSKAASWALLSRVYLSMGNYVKAEEAATACLKLNGVLLDFNTVDITAPNPFPVSESGANPEIIFDQILSSSAFVTVSGVDSLFYRTYHENDLRKTAFYFDAYGMKMFKGSYSGTTQLFGGLTTSEVYFTRAECYARNGKTELALADLDYILKRRWRNETYLPLTLHKEEVLEKILLERRKELVARGIRWFDLRRLNKERQFSKHLERFSEGITYKLPANDNRYTFPIPDNEISSSSIIQNPR